MFASFSVSKQEASGIFCNSLGNFPLFLQRLRQLINSKKWWTKNEQIVPTKKIIINGFDKTILYIGKYYQVKICLARGGVRGKFYAL